MNLLLIVTTATLLVGITTSARAENPDHVRQLLRTNACEGCELSGVNLTGVDLTGANLSGANLSGATLARTNLARANLSNANLSDAELAGANFRGADLTQANLSRAIANSFCREPFNAPDSPECLSFSLFFSLGPELCDESYGLMDLELEEVNSFLSGFCDTESAAGSPFGSYEFFLTRSGFFTGATMQGANLNGANLSDASLQGVDLRYATLSGADLSQTNLTYALLLEASVDQVANADFSNTFLSKADVQEAVRTAILAEREAARRAEVRNIIGAMNRAQQAYHLELNRFAVNFEELALGIAAETENYRYAIIPQANATDRVLHIAQPKTEGLSSVIGAVFVLPSTGDDPGSEEYTTVTIMCETVEPSMMPPEAPTPPASLQDPIECPPGSRSLQE